MRLVVEVCFEAATFGMGWQAAPRAGISETPEAASAAGGVYFAVAHSELFGLGLLTLAVMSAQDWEEVVLGGGLWAWTEFMA